MLKKRGRCPFSGWAARTWQQKYAAYPIFATHRAIVYVLPDIKPVQQVFGSYDVATLRLQAAPPTVRAVD